VKEIEDISHEIIRRIKSIFWGNEFRAALLKEEIMIWVLLILLWWQTGFLTILWIESRNNGGIITREIPLMMLEGFGGAAILALAIYARVKNSIHSQ
jgi:hypothetical protein